MLLAGPFYAASALLVAAGAQKVADPKPLGRALRTLGLPLPGVVLRIGAAGEIAIGMLGLLRGDRVSALLVAGSYTLFTVVVLLALARGGVLASCGCFGKRDLPPTKTHLAVTGGFAAAALTGAPGPLHAADALLPLAVTTLAVAACAYLTLALLPLLSPPTASPR